MSIEKLNENKKPSNPNSFPNDAPSFFGASDGGGMTLRDYFANSAMQGIHSSLETVRAMAQDMRNLTNDKENDTVLDYIAQESYRIADAMLKQREL